MRTKIKPAERKRIIHVVSLGCPKNQVDSEKLIGRLSEHIFTDNPVEADTIIINTCGFINDAKEESINEILTAARLKEQSLREGTPKEIIVMGCLSQRYGKDLIKEIPEIDRLYGVHESEKIVRDLGHHAVSIDRHSRRLLNPSHYAYLKISDGCNHRCGFCAIPSIRGRLISTPAKSLVEEAKRLADSGVKELILVSQDTTAYGFDLMNRAGKGNLPLIRLLEKLHAVDDIEWIRLMYFYPTLISADLLKAMSALPKICPYIDVPIQHISDSVLRLMRRGTPSVRIRQALDQIRDILPHAAVRTAVIVGHPGETSYDYRELCSFVKAYRFDRLGVFQYSREDGTHSHGLTPQSSSRTRQERYDRLMALQQPIALELNRNKIGQTLKVLIDRKEDNTYFGRTVFDAPDIDHEVIIGEAEGIYTGAFADIHITDAYEYDLTGQPVKSVPDFKGKSRSL